MITATYNKNMSIITQAVDLHAGLSLLLQLGNGPSQAKKKATFSMLQRAVETLEAIPEQGTGLMLSDYPIEILETSDSIVQSVRITSPLPPTE
ncbi:MAG: hypothetical protein DRR42_25075 [Gammaproteobacteria bacterium]|nr:MAG: hypothetical protein DRR42_25075 [Gammaproteobacteria bacterium]